MERRAIFIDRDGTLNEEMGFISEQAQFRLFDFAADAVRMINDAGWLAIVVTNQSGIARGLYTEDFLCELHERMKLSLAEQGAHIDAIYYCPHHPDTGLDPYLNSCNCRKPKTGMIERAAKDFGLDLKNCFVIGDRYRDLAMGHAVGAQSVMVMTGYGRVEHAEEHQNWARQPDHISNDLLEAVEWILKAV